MENTGESNANANANTIDPQHWVDAVHTIQYNKGQEALLGICSRTVSLRSLAKQRLARHCTR